jgi:RimJ/RimL family protein N-acetyltransferase
MILIDKNNYDKVLKPLMKVTINNLFARAVVERKVDGLVYIDNEQNPRTFYVVHPYGMSLLFGDTENHSFNSAFLNYSLNTFRIREKYEWMQAFPDSWHPKLASLFGDHLIKVSDNQNDAKGKIEENTRVNFKFNKEKYFGFRKIQENTDFKIVRTNKEMFQEIEGSVVPKHFWNDSESFLRHKGIGFSLIYEGKPASTAYSAFIEDKKLELGIETIEACRGMGFAELTCMALIDYSLKHGYEPIWSCRFENTGSYKLAQKLGFEPTIFFPFYRLNN